MPRRILSIASAPGWKASIHPEGEEKPHVAVLASWALVENTDGATEIVGMVQRSATPEAPNGRLGFADEVEGFKGYTFTGLTTRTPGA
jgi:hypothetical protein